MNIAKGFHNVLVLMSQALNVVFYGGRPDETLSARSHREGRLLGDAKWSKRADRIDTLFRNPQHCAESHAADVEFARMIVAVEYLTTDCVTARSVP